jgi:hypothetical protein
VVAFFWYLSRHRAVRRYQAKTQAPLES